MTRRGEERRSVKGEIMKVENGVAWKWEGRGKKVLVEGIVTEEERE